MLSDTRKQALSDIKSAKEAIFRIQSVLPEIASAITTNGAARAVLNSQRHAVRELYEEGVLDAREAGRVIGAIETQMKRLLYTPPHIELPTVEQL